MEELKLQGFGPIGEGWLDLSPLTILIGPNGCGKSYTAMALHSLAKDKAGDRALQANEIILGSLSQKHKQELNKVQEEIVEEDESQLSKETTNEIIESYCDLILKEKFQNSLRDTFSVQLFELITVGRDKIVFKLSTELGVIKIGYYEGWGEMRVEEYPSVSQDINLQSKNSDDREDFVKKSQEEITLRILERSFRFRRGAESIVEGISFCLSTVFHPRPFGNSYYLPAPRAGFLESHDILSAGAFNRLSSAGIEPIEVPAFSGAVSDYLTEISGISQSDEMSDLADIANTFEREVLGGQVKVEQADNEPQPNILFEQYGREFPFYLTSTGISELAPLTLFTKYRLSSNSMMVIEEPEAHLHPENQRRIAYYIARLVNRGVKIVVTTHSDFFVEQINNLIRLSEIEESKKKEKGLDDLPALNHENISVNMFYSKNMIEYEPESLEIDGINGIPMDQFEDVTDELYGQARQVDHLLQQELGGKNDK